MKINHRWDKKLLKRKLRHLKQLENTANLDASVLDKIQKSKFVYTNLLSKFNEYSNSYKAPEEFVGVDYKSYFDLFYSEMTRHTLELPGYFDDHILFLNRSISEFPFIFVPSFNPVITSKKKLLMDVRSFIRSTDINLYTILNKVERRNPSLYHIENRFDQEGFFSNDDYYELPHIYVSKTNTIIDRYILAHEIGHAMEFVYTPNLFLKKKPTNEIFSQLMELILDDYHQSISYEPIENLKVSKAMYNKTIEAAEFASNLLELFEAMKKKTNFCIDDFYDLFPFADDDYFEELLTADFTNKLRYPYSLVIALELFNQYQENPKEALINIKTLLENGSSDEIDSIYRSIGINTAELSTNRFEKIQKKPLVKSQEISFFQF